MALQTDRKDGFAMSKRKMLVYNLEFWGVIGFALTAEWWMDLICRLVF